MLQSESLAIYAKARGYVSSAFLLIPGFEPALNVVPYAYTRVDIIVVS